MFQFARMQQRIGIKWEQVLASYLQACEYQPTRIELLYEIVKHYRATERYQMALTFGAIWTVGFEYPKVRLVIDCPVYTDLMAAELLCCA
jgi:hypothetical protein